MTTQKEVGKIFEAQKKRKKREKPLKMGVGVPTKYDEGSKKR